MKNTLYISIFLLFLVLASCEKEELETNSPTPSGQKIDTLGVSNKVKKTASEGDDETVDDNDRES